MTNTTIQDEGLTRIERIHKETEAEISYHLQRLQSLYLDVSVSLLVYSEDKKELVMVIGNNDKEDIRDACRRFAKQGKKLTAREI